ncbi:MAG: hydroxymethylglutaryl-CoA lyase [Gammaproteobacteria bacterium]|nr:hydroxymethylglutaryl-CoA lyase [Gammaproteobacteria bacterium]
MKLPQQIEVIEVGPRDGLQAQERHYSVETKLALIDLLVEAGIRTIEVTGFVRPDVIPQLADGPELIERLPKRDDVTYRVLCPNLRGAQRAVNAKVDELLGLIVASDSYNQKNARMTVDENLAQLVDMAKLSRESGIPMVTAIGCAMFCPYEGDTPPQRVLSIVDRLWEEGVRSFYVAVSVGLDAPITVGNLVAQIKDAHPDARLGVHLHNTNGMALASALAAAEAGAEFFEGSISGIGGGIRMPYGMAPYGNVATEDLVHLFNECGVDTGLDTMKVVEAARSAKELLELDNTHSYALQGAIKDVVLAQGRT